MLVDTKMADRGMGLVEPLRVTRNGRRYFSAAHKRAVVQKCLVPGASLAAVALSCGFNANLVRRWVRQYQERSVSTKLVPVMVTPGMPSRPQCTAGANACPPDDVGGVPGYCDFVAAVLDPKHPEHRELLQWYGAPFDPYHFDMDAINSQLKRIRI